LTWEKNSWVSKVPAFDFCSRWKCVRDVAARTTVHRRHLDRLPLPVFPGVLNDAQGVDPDVAKAKSPGDADRIHIFARQIAERDVTAKRVDCG